MAKMIPSQYATNTPRGEKTVFDLLRNDPDTAGWVVLHSYDISRHATKRTAEIDMVVLIPELGVLCLEVKGSKVSRSDGIWDYGYKQSREGPFRQASSAMHGLMKSLSALDSSCTDVLFWSGVIFTAQNFYEKSPEWHSWQFIDASDMNRRPISRLVTTMLIKAHAHSRSRRGSSYWYDETRSRPTEGQINRLVDVMRGDFEAIMSPKDLVRQTERTIERFTQEQYSVLDALQDNDRILVDGLAGTGKSLLALEAVRRAVLTGKSVLLICFNKLLGKWMTTQVDQDSVGSSVTVRVRHIHGLMRDISGHISNPESGSDYWAKELPEQTLLALWEDENAPKFDVLVVDEAQDILTAEYLDVLNELLAGGLAGGRWLMFGDFENQAIYLENPDSSAEDMKQMLTDRAPHHARHRLTINCRNPERIARVLTSVCHVSPGYTRTIPDLDGADVDPFFWTDHDDQQCLLLETLRKLRETFDARDIVVLSTHKDARSCAAGLTSHDGRALVALRSSSSDDHGTAYASIHAFKGLEARAIIVTDITSLAKKQRSLLYVAMSRARVRLVLLMHESCRAPYKQVYLSKSGSREGNRP